MIKKIIIGKARYWNQLDQTFLILILLSRNILQDEKPSELSLGFQMLEMRKVQIKIKMEHRITDIFNKKCLESGEAFFNFISMCNLHSLSEQESVIVQCN